MIEKSFDHIRSVNLSKIIEAIKEMTISANYNLNNDIRSSLKKSIEIEESKTGINIINQLLTNADIASNQKMPICQDTGMAVFFVEIGQNVHIINDIKNSNNIIKGTLEEGINEGVRQGYTEGYLRKSVVNDPFERINTGDNTPAIIHYDIIAGDSLKISFAPKGFGSENMSRIYMIKPGDGIEGAKKVILEAIDAAGPNACPPMVIGIGIGGSFEKAAILAKKALFRSINESSKIPYVKDLEEELLQKANNLGIGPQGMGGRITVLGINILTYATHIAGLPVAINISCHATRHAEVNL